MTNTKRERPRPGDEERPERTEESVADLDASPEDADKVTGGGPEKPADFIFC